MKTPRRSARLVLFLALVMGCSKPPGQQPPPPEPMPQPEPEPNPNRSAFPLGTPALGGYTLTDAFPNFEPELPMALAWPKVGPASPFMLGRWGTINQIENGRQREVLNIKSEVHLQQEGGALGMALHPDFGDGTGPNPYVYVWYNAEGSTQHLSRFTWDPATRVFGNELVMVSQTELYPQIHNAGRMQFGPDGFLYFGNGDDQNPLNHQTISRALFAGIFRIDVDMRGGSVSHPPPRMPEGATTTGYFIPNDNPFVGVPGAVEEFYALGFRNPFAFAFDRMTGALYMGDVGEVWREEINRVEAGGNYEWPYREAELVLDPKTPTIGTAHPPLYAYSHAEMGELASIIGGFVYRGTALPELQGKFIYSDWPSARVWALDVSGPVAKRTTLLDVGFYGDVIGFAQDNDGEVYVLREQQIAKLTRDVPVEHVPQKLSETILFDRVKTFAVAPGFVPYDVISPLWTDGAVKQRFVRVPEGKKITANAEGGLELPVGTVLMKQFDLPRDATGRTRRMETRAIIVGSTETYGVTYRWNADGTDGELVTEPADEDVTFASEPASQTWHYPSFGQCWECHRRENRVIGFTLGQLAMTKPDGKPQLDALVAAGVLDPAVLSAPRPTLVSPADEHAPLEARAMSYLAANCGHCHHDGVFFHGGEQTWIATPGVPMADRGLINAPHHNSRVATALGMPHAKLIDPGHPETSLVLGRLKTTEQNLRMPPVGRTLVGPAGTQVIEDWIRSLQP